MSKRSEFAKPSSLRPSKQPAFKLSEHPSIQASELLFFQGKRVFITGHTGFKGAWFSRVLANAGAEVTGYALEPPTKPSLFVIAKIEKNMHSIIGDIRDLQKLSKTIKKTKPEIVIHMAAQPLVREAYKNPVYTYETNVMGTVNLLESCRTAASVRSIVNVTTDKVYENRESQHRYCENENLCGYDPYSNSKSCSDILTSSYRQSFFYMKDSVAVSTARSGNVIGGGDFAADRIIPDCLRAAWKNKPVIIRHPEAVRPYQHVLDCLSGYLLLAKKQYESKKYEGSYNFGPEKQDLVNNARLVRIFCAMWGSGMRSINKKDNGPHEAGLLKLDITKAKKVLGWKPGLDVKAAVGLTVEWGKEYMDKGDVVKCMDRQINNYFGKG